MKSLILAILFALCLCSCGCSDSNYELYLEKESRCIGESDQWKIFKVNDTVVVCLPRLNADKKLQPVVLNLKDVNIK